MKVRLLIIDPQNDFCDIAGAALPVAGADADMRRLAALMNHARAKLADIAVTLDSHATVGIERTTFWITADGQPVAPFTQIAESDVRAGRFAPRDGQRLPEVLAYLAALEQGGRYKLIVWPVHCVLGTWGHNIHDAVAAELAGWELQSQRIAFRVLKGLNPMTEQYSAVQAEVPTLAIRSLKQTAPWSNACVPMTDCCWWPARRPVIAWLPPSGTCSKHSAPRNDAEW